MVALLWGCGGGGGGVSVSGIGDGSGWSEIGNPGAEGPLDIETEVPASMPPVAQSSSTSFLAYGEVINQGDYSSGLTITAYQGCLDHAVCLSDPGEFPTAGTTEITVYTTQLTPVGRDGVVVTFYEEHYGALGGLGPKVRVSTTETVPVTVQSAYSPLIFDHTSTPLTEIRDLRVGANSPNVMAVGDLDGDGLDDMLLSAAYGKWEVVLGASDRTLEQLAMDFGPSASDVLIADISGDGLNDVVVTNALGMFAHEALAARLEFADPVTLFDAGRPREIEYFDVDGDDIKDLVTHTDDGDLVTVLLDASGNSTEGPTSWLSGRINEMDPLDFDGDGDVDLISAGGALELYANDGSGRFSFVGNVYREGPVNSVAAEDIDGDALADLVAAYADDDQIVVLFGDGNGGFGAPVMLDSVMEPVVVSVLDVDADGRKDVVALVQRLQRVSVFRHAGGAGFDSGLHYPATLLADELASGDFDNDLRSDMAVIGWNNPLALLWNDTGR